MMKKQVFLIFAALLMTAQGAWADFVVDLPGSGTEADPYVIEDAGDWNTLATSVNSGNTFSGKFVKMTADITLPASAKSIGVYDNNSKVWQGTFDGNGHTLTVAYNKTSGRGIAPFMHIYAGAVIKNLCVKGSISANARVVASIVAQAGDAGSTETMTCTIEKCWSEVAINSTISGAMTYAGGLVSEVQGYTTLNMTDCAFIGSFTYSSDSWQCGGLVSYLETNGIANLTRCTFVPSELNMVKISGKTGTNDYYTFVGGLRAKASFNKCYYDLSKTGVDWFLTQGTNASGMTAAVLAATLANGWGVKDGNAVPLMANIAVFTDADTYTLTADKAVTSATYKKTLNESRVGKFQAWFLPFDYTITSEDLENFQFYKINVIANSETEDGKIEIHLIKCHAGDVYKANKPYVYKPKKAVENYEFTTNNATLKAKNVGKVHSMSTSLNDYKFYGTYDVMTPTIDDPFYYVNINGDLSWGYDGKVKVGAFRWIIRVENKDDYARGISFSEEDGNEATGINSIDNAQLAIDNYYDMNGRKLDKKPTQKGVYINNGRKIIIK